MTGYSPVRTKPEMSTQEQEPTGIELTAGEANSNWNLRHRLHEIEDYPTAVKKGFIGSDLDWEAFRQEIGEPVDPGAPEPEPVAIDPQTDHQIPPTNTPIPDLAVKLASTKASKINTVYRTGPFVRLVLWLAAAFLVVLTALGLAFFQIYTKAVTHERIDRPVDCAINKDGVEITGKRNYSYINNSFGPYHWQNDETLLERTTVNVSMNGLTVVMITDGESKTLRRGQAEGGILILPKADYYTFFVNGKATGASYAELCK
jgi:hypothetical protein